MAQMCDFVLGLAVLICHPQNECFVSSPAATVTQHFKDTCPVTDLTQSWLGRCLQVISYRIPFEYRSALFHK